MLTQRLKSSVEYHFILIINLPTKNNEILLFPQSLWQGGSLIPADFPRRRRGKQQIIPLFPAESSPAAEDSAAKYLAFRKIHFLLESLKPVIPAKR